MGIRKQINSSVQQMMELYDFFKHLNLQLQVSKSIRAKINLQIWILFFKEKWKVVSMKLENTIFI